MSVSEHSRGRGGVGAFFMALRNRQGSTVEYSTVQYCKVEEHSRNRGRGDVGAFFMK